MKQLLLIALALYLTACTFAYSSPQHITSMTLGVAEVRVCQQTETGRAEDFTKVITNSCHKATSSGFTGWDTLDAAIAGFVSWITLGGVVL